MKKERIITNAGELAMCLLATKKKLKEKIEAEGQECLSPIDRSRAVRLLHVINRLLNLRYSEGNSVFIEVYHALAKEGTFSMDEPKSIFL
jgi:hypothetical protein